MSKLELTDKEKAENYKQIVLEVPLHVTDRVMSGADSVGESLQHFLIKSADERIERMKNDLS